MCNILLKVCNNLHDSCELNMRLLASYLHAVPAIASWCHGVMLGLRAKPNCSICNYFLKLKA